MKKISLCEVCASKKLLPVLNLGPNPLCDDLLPINSKKKNKLYKIEILLCNNCFTAHQKYQVKKELLFPKNYHYRAALTKDVIDGMQDLARSTKKFFKNFRNKTVLDIGCNDGSLLKSFKKMGAKTVGIEPTNAIKEGINIDYKIQEYFNNKSVNKVLEINKKIDLITFTNVFAHIDDLNKMINNLKKLINKNTILVIENHYLGSILKYNQFDTFYHEHPRTYSLTSFKFIADKLNMKIIDYVLPKRYGGNIRVYLSRNIKVKNYKINNEKNIKKDFFLMRKFIKEWKIRFTNDLISLNKKYGPLRAKAFPGRASILINELNLTNKNIKCVYEKPNSLKINHYLPGTKIKILNDKEFDFKDNSPIINFAWHINIEIKKYMKSKGFNGKIIPIIKK